MSKLLDRLKAEAKQLKTREESRESGTFEKINWFSAQKGDNLVRIMPNKNPDELFFKKVNIHYIKIKKKDGGMANVPVRCMSDFDKTCPLCTVYRELIGSDETKDDAKNFRPIERYIYNLLDYSKREVTVYAAPLTVHSGFMEWIEELDTDISDLEIGHDFKIIKEVDPKKGIQFGTSYKVRPKLKPSAVPTKLRGLEVDVIELDKIYGEERLKEMNDFLRLNGYDAVEVKEEKKATGTTKTFKKEEPKKEEPVDDGFAKDEEPVEDDGFAKEEKIPEDTGAIDDDLERELKELGVS